MQKFTKSSHIAILYDIQFFYYQYSMPFHIQSMFSFYLSCMDKTPTIVMSEWTLHYSLMYATSIMHLLSR